MQVPMAIIYKANPATYFIAKKIANVNCLGLCNIICREEVAPEFLQDDMRAEKIGAYIEKVIENNAFREAQKSQLAKVKDELIAQGKNHDITELVLSHLD